MYEMNRNVVDIFGRHVMLLVLSIVICSTIHAQEVVINSKRGYYISKLTVVKGIYIENANADSRAGKISIPEQNNHHSVILYPSDIDEYGFDDGLRYISSSIIYNGQSQKVFLKEVQRVSDSIIIYCFSNASRDIYYIQYSNGSRIEVSSSGTEIWNLFKERSTCTDTEELKSTPRILNDAMITTLYLAYFECNKNFVQRWQYGLVAGLGFGSLQTINNFTRYRFGIAVHLGAFIQIPLDEYFVFRPELLFSRLQSKEGFTTINDQVVWNNELYIRYSVQMPFIFRYNFNAVSQNNIPYIEGGPLIDKNLYSSFLKNDFQYGFLIGAGIRCRLNDRHLLNIGLRYNHATGSAIENYKPSLFGEANSGFLDKVKLNINTLSVALSYNL